MIWSTGDTSSDDGEQKSKPLQVHAALYHSLESIKKDFHLLLETGGKV
jgi:hypothetical protein